MKLAAVPSVLLKFVSVTLVVELDPAVCFTSLVPGVVWSVPKHTHPVVTPAGRVIVQADPGAVPTPIVKANVPLLLAIVAADPPQPAPAIVGAVVEPKM